MREIDPFRFVEVPRRQLEHYERAAAQRIEDILEAAYPGHIFHVRFQASTLIAFIGHPLMPEGAHMILKAADDDPEGKTIRRLGGEILERLNIPRTALEDITVYDAVTHEQAKDAFKLEK